MAPAKNFPACSRSLSVPRLSTVPLLALLLAAGLVEIAGTHNWAWFYILLKSEAALLPCCVTTSTHRPAS